MSKKYDTLIYIGRFQPYTINICLSRNNNETIQTNIFVR